ncbi:MAG: MBL fold metallo-hydrolase [Actinobacteria bacterium]|nr:MBL fold metallo-hydrolase [Actinomycetota bacterium]
MTDLGPMPPTPDIGPVASGAGTLQPIAPNVWAWIGTGTGNAGVVIEDDGITVIDTLLAPSVARALNNEIADRFGLPIKRVIYTSSHLDSVGGSAVFWMAARYGRTQTNVLLDQPAPIDAYKRLAPAFAHDYDTNPRTAEVPFATRPVSHVVDAAAWLSPLVLAVPVSGQQDENLVILVPSAGVMFAGAFLTIGTTPNAWDGDPVTWADTLGELADQATVIVPGYGPIGAPRHVHLLQAYLYACDDASGDPSRIPAGPWDDWTGRDLDAVNVERAVRVAQGDRGVPRTMLERLGMGDD